MLGFFRCLKDFDWVLLLAVLLVVSLGLFTTHSFSSEDIFFDRQMGLLIFSVTIFFIVGSLDVRFLRRTGVVMTFFFLTLLTLLILLATGKVTQGVQRWLELGPFSIQVSEFAKLVLIIILAKYFTKRHIDIKRPRHIFISGGYAGIFFVLVFLQPDLGSAVILGLVWLGMVTVSGISLKHLGLISLMATVAFLGMWMFALQDYQKQRLISFIEPYTDLEGSGYHVRQSIIAIGSGEIFGKGVGYGTQSQLRFLPEYQTDFIFAAFAEEWGFAGVILLFTLYGLIIWRILINTHQGLGNFEVLFSMGLAILFLTHITIHVGANIGLLPVTGTTLPFMSYGGSHLLVSFMALGILMSMRRHGRIVSREVINKEVMIN